MRLRMPAQIPFVRHVFTAMAIFILAMTFVGASSAAFGDHSAAVVAQDDGAGGGGSGAAATNEPQARNLRTEGSSGGTPLERGTSFIGIFGLIGIAWILSNNRRAIDWRLVSIGVGLQLFFAVIVLKTSIGRAFFDGVTAGFNRLLGFTADGAAMLFWGQETLAATFAFGILPTIIFFSSLMTVLYHLGVMQAIVRVVAGVMRVTMRTSGSETLSAAANIFVGQTEAPLMVKPYVSTMTKSELMAVMTGGFATVAGGVMAAYIGMLSRYFPDIGGHLLAASVMSAPASLVIAKIMYPETEESPTRGRVQMTFEKPDANIIDAAARGASEGMMLAINVAAMLLAFVALVSLVNFLFSLPSYWQHLSVLKSIISEATAAGASLPADLLSTCNPETVAAEQRAQCAIDLTAAWGDSAPTKMLWPTLTLQKVLGWAFFPIAVLMGTPLADAGQVGQLLGTKTVLNEFVAYGDLATMMSSDNPVSERAAIIASYALCGFANFGSIAIQIGGIGSLAPERRQDLARLGFFAMIAGSLAAFMTAAVVGVLV